MQTIGVVVYNIPISNLFYNNIMHIYKYTISIIGSGSLLTYNYFFLKMK